MMIVVHELVAPAAQIAVEPAAFCTAGSDYVRKTPPGEARFRHAAVGGWGALRGSDVDNSNCVLLPLVCPCTNDCWLQLQPWILDRFRKKPFEIGWRAPLSS